jgi:hypothetical protein
MSSGGVPREDRRKEQSPYSISGVGRSDRQFRRGETGRASRSLQTVRRNFGTTTSWTRRSSRTPTTSGWESNVGSLGFADEQELARGKSGTKGSDFVGRSPASRVQGADHGCPSVHVGDFLYRPRHGPPDPGRREGVGLYKEVFRANAPIHEERARLPRNSSGKARPPSVTFSPTISSTRSRTTSCPRADLSQGRDGIRDRRHGDIEGRQEPCQPRRNGSTGRLRPKPRLSARSTRPTRRRRSKGSSFPIPSSLEVNLIAYEFPVGGQEQESLHR